MVNKQTLITTLTQILKRGDLESKLMIFFFLESNLIKGNNFHFELKNKLLVNATTELYKFLAQNADVLLAKRELNKTNTSYLLHDIETVFNTKLESNLLDWNSYINTLQTVAKVEDLKQSNKESALYIYNPQFFMFFNKVLMYRELKNTNRKICSKHLNIIWKYLVLENNQWGSQIKPHSN